MDIRKICKALIWAFAIIVGVFAVYVFCVYTINAKLPCRTLGEFTGSVLAVLMGYQLLFLLAIQGMKRKWIPENRRKAAISLIKFFREFHRCVGTLIIALLVLHTAINLDLTNLLIPHNVAGYFTALFAAIAVIFGILRKRNLQLYTKLHYIFGYSAILPFIVHMIIK